MFEDILVSVIIPTHHRIKELLRAVDSVCRQTHRNLEIIVVDDNSDKIYIRNVITDMLKYRDSRLQIIYNASTLGGALSRNQGVSVAKGDFIAFLDDDDERSADSIEKQLMQFHVSTQMNLGLVYCFGKIIYPNGVIEDELTDDVGIPLEKHMKCNLAGTSFWLMKKSIFFDVGGFKPIASHQDGVVILNLLAKGYSVDLVRESLINYYVHDKANGITGVTKSNLLADEQYFKLCNNHFDLLSKKAQRRVEVHYYKDRNWNLIMLNMHKEAFNDIKLLLKKHFFSGAWFVCLMRILFHKCVVKKEVMRLAKYGMGGDCYEGY